MSNVKLSIIIPVYNVEKYIGECLDSCVNQDLDNKDYEIICINDGSIDSSEDILKRYSEHFSNVFYYNKENGGVAEARNLGLNKALGTYIWFVDSDDFIQENVLKKFIEVIEKNDYPDLFRFGAYEFGDFTTDATLTQYEIEHKHELKNCRSEYDQYDDMLWRHWYKRNIVTDHNICFDKEIKACSDNLFHFTFDIYLKSQIIISDVGYFYRKRTMSITSSGTPEKYYNSRIKMATVFREFYYNNIGRKDVSGYILSSQLRMVLKHIAKMKNPRRRNELKRLKSLGLFPLEIDEIDTYFEIKKEETTKKNKKFNWMYNHIYTKKGYRYYRMTVIKGKIRNRIKLK